jgi:hypothetical protein
MKKNIVFIQPAPEVYFPSPLRNENNKNNGTGGCCPPPPPQRLQSRKVGQMFNISRAKSGKLKQQKAPSLLGKQRQSGNIRFAVRQYWLIITGTNYVNFVVNSVIYGKGV